MVNGRVRKWTVELLPIAAMVVLLARCQVHENPGMARRMAGAIVSVDLAEGGIATTLVFDAVILSLGLLWWLFSGQVNERFGRGGPAMWGLALTWGILTISGAGTAWGASDRLPAISGAVTVATGVFWGIWLLAWLDRPWKRRLVTAGLIAAFIAVAWQGVEEYTVDRPQLIAMYQQNPQAALAMQGIPPGGYREKLFEQRLRHRDVTGPFTLSNTAATFLMMGLFLLAGLLVETARATPPALNTAGAGAGPRAETAGTNRQAGRISPGLRILLLAGLLVFLAVPFMWTGSKGAVGSLIVGGLAVLLLRGLREHIGRRPGLWVGLLVAAALVAVAAVVAVGLRLGRLPSASLWVRWQYWTAGARLLADQGLWGVGANNFGHYYPRYMNPLAPEVVSDPHSLWLTLACEWGLPGLLAVVIGAVMVGYHLAGRLRASPGAVIKPPCDSESHPALVAVGTLAAAVVVCVIRLSSSHLGGISDDAELTAVLVVVFVVPAIVTWLGLLLGWLLSAGLWDDESPSGRLGIGLMVGGGVLAVLLHNSIDLGLTRPAVLGVVMCLVALVASRSSESQAIDPEQKNRRWPTILRLGVAMAVLAGPWWAVLRVVRQQGLLERAQQSAINGDESAARALLTQAGIGVPFDAEPYAMLARLTEQRAWQSAQAELIAGGRGITDPRETTAPSEMIPPAATSGSNTDDELSVFASKQARKPLTRAIVEWREALERDPESFQYPREISRLMAGLALQAGDQPPITTEEAIEATTLALRRYPSDAELGYRLARLLQADQPQRALAILQTILEREAAFLAEQRRMFPDRDPPWPRVHPAVLERIEQLAATLTTILQGEQPNQSGDESGSAE